jgi:hypothetical protein
MKCQAAYVWLLASKATVSLPDEVQRHLGHCRRCQLCRKRLARLDGELKRLPSALESSQVKDRLFQKLAHLPASSAPLTSQHQPPHAGKRSWHVRAWATAAAVLLGIGLGWLLGRVDSPPAQETPLASTPSRKTPIAGSRMVDLVARVVGYDLSLAETFSPVIQTRALSDLAADLCREALRLAREGPLEDLPLVAALYQRVLQGGLIGRARVLPADGQPAVLTPLANQLQESALVVSHAAEDSLPAIGDYLRTMAVTANETSQALRAATNVPPLAAWLADSSSPRPLLETVVVEGLRLAEEDDPLRRADSCSRVVEQLVQTILLTSARGEAKPASTLGKCLGEMVDRGVVVNLNRAKVDDADKDRMAERERVRRRVAAASAVLESNLQRAPPQARAGLQRAMEASRGGLERAAQAGKGKGNSKSNGIHGRPPKDRPFFPPGLEKKRGKNSEEQWDKKNEQE